MNDTLTLIFVKFLILPSITILKYWEHRPPDSSVYKFGLFAVFKLNYGNCALYNGFAVILAKNEKQKAIKSLLLILYIILFS